MKQIYASCTVSRITERWPLAVFFRHLDRAVINARVIFKFNNLSNKDNKRVFLKKLFYVLMKDHLKERLLMQSLRFFSFCSNIKAKRTKPMRSKCGKKCIKT